MAFSRDGLTRIGSGTGSAPSIWSYASTDAIATVNTTAYFNDASAELGIRDVILVTDTATPTTNWCVVLTNAAGVVDVSDGTAIAETDTD